MKLGYARVSTEDQRLDIQRTRLTEAGLLMRRRDDRDHRLVRLWLTDAGRALQEPIEAERRLMEEKLTADLTETEREHLMKALAKIHQSATDMLGSL